MIRSFQHLTQDEVQRAGGKGRALAELTQAGIPVPPGFVILTDAFTADTLHEEAWTQTKSALAAMRARTPGISFAVRSSAIGEDSAEHSFAGAFLTELDLRDDAGIRRSIEAVRASGNAARVAAYSQAQGIQAPREIAVVVQELVPAERSGVLFTADPVSGSTRTMVGNYVRGLGEKLVSGETNAETFCISRPSGKLEASKDVSREIAKVARELFRLGARIEHLRGGPQDIEWAEVRGKVSILQARPITTLRGEDLATGECNDSRTGEYLWTSSNVGEAVPDVMTPCTWSLLRRFLREPMLALYGYGVPPIGNIGGRLYVNLSVSRTIAWAFGLSAYVEKISELVFGRVPAEMKAPRLPLSRLEVLSIVVPNALQMKRRIRANQSRFAAFIAGSPARAAALADKVAQTHDGPSLVALFEGEIAPYANTACWMLEAGARSDGNVLVKVRGELESLVGASDSNALLTGLHGGGQALASLGPLLGLEQLARGEIDRETYGRLYGHRGPHEFEVSAPRIAEDPALLERELSQVREAMREGSATALLARQQQARKEAWARFEAKSPKKARQMKKRIDAAADAARAREDARSEIIRAYGVIRRFVLRASALLGLGDEVFFMTLEEIEAALSGGALPDPAHVAARRAMHALYVALPPYPTLIRGRFDPFRWASDPARRSDVFDASATGAGASAATRGVGGASAPGVLRGFPGAAGVVEGRVRVLSAVDQGLSLEAGEVLVTSATNVGWTPLFPRALAIVTDVGAPLSHASIVARELGIPAVVGCGTATSFLKTGDRVRVDGGKGTVEVLSRAVRGDGGEAQDAAPGGAA